MATLIGILIGAFGFNVPSSGGIPDGALIDTTTGAYLIDTTTSAYLVET